MRLLVSGWVMLFCAASVLAQTTPGWGTSSEIVYPMFAADFDPVFSDTVYGDQDGRYATSGSFYAGLKLPAGSIIQRLELDACDDSSSGEVRVSLGRRSLTAVSGIVTVETGVPFSDGCATFPVVLVTPETVDNENVIYVLSVSTNSFTTATRFLSVRVYYKLQVSPAPATARFSDVPTTHPFFQFIEALAGAGITGGCNATPPQYCPNDFVTRGQMAAFLARALGLHWAP